MICPDCGMDFDLDYTRSEFDMSCEDPTYSYDSIGEYVCFDCARRRFEALFENAEDYDGEYDDIF